jgi:hypothetical protein
MFLPQLSRFDFDFVRTYSRGTTFFSLGETTAGRMKGLS